MKRSVFAILPVAVAASEPMLSAPLAAGPVKPPRLLEQEVWDCPGSVHCGPLREAQLTLDMLAHDLNGVTASMLAAVGQLALQLPTEHPLQAVSERVRRSAARARDLVAQMLDPARRRGEGRQACDLGVLLDDVADLLCPGLSLHQRLTVYRQAGPRWAWVDPSHFLRAMINVCRNALQAFGGRPGQVRLYAGLEPAQAGMARVVIEDDGPGMDRQTLALACQPFHSTRRAEGGHGLGLAMVDRFVRDHGGHLHIDSEPGRGTRVELLLPAPAVAQWPAGAAAEPPCAETLHGPALAALGHGGPVEVPQVKSQRLLYVDDDAVLRQVVGHVLGTAGYEVTMAETLVEARALLRPGGASFDVVVSDVYLPDGTGFDVLDCWRALRRPGRAYLVSGRTGEDLRQRAGRHGALALIPKDRFFDPATPFASMDRLAAAAEPSCPPAA